MLNRDNVAARLYGQGQGTAAPALVPVPAASAQPQTRAQSTTLQTLFPTLDISKVTDPEYMLQYANEEGTYQLKGADGQMYDLATTLGADPADGGSINVTHHYGEGDAGGGQYYEFGRDGNLLAGREYKNDPNGVRDFITMGAMVLGPLAGGGAAGAAGGTESGAVSGMDLAADGAVGNSIPGYATNSAAEAAAGQSGMDLAADGAPGNAWGTDPALSPTEGATNTLGQPADATEFPHHDVPADTGSGTDWEALQRGYQVGSLLTGLFAKPQMPDMTGGGAQQPVGTLEAASTNAGASATGNAVGGVAGSQPGVAGTFLTTFDDENTYRPGAGSRLLGG